MLEPARLLQTICTLIAIYALAAVAAANSFAQLFPTPTLIAGRASVSERHTVSPQEAPSVAR